MTVKNQVIEALKTGPKTSTEIANITNIKRSSVKVALCAMYKKDFIARDKIATDGVGPNQVYCYRLKG